MPPPPPPSQPLSPSPSSTPIPQLDLNHTFFLLNESKNRLRAVEKELEASWSLPAYRSPRARPTHHAHHAARANNTRLPSASSSPHDQRHHYPRYPSAHDQASCARFRLARKQGRLAPEPELNPPHAFNASHAVSPQVAGGHVIRERNCTPLSMAVHVLVGTQLRTRTAIVHLTPTARHVKKFLTHHVFGPFTHVFVEK